MAKNKWEKLSKAMLSMLQGIEDYVESIHSSFEKYNLLQLHIYVKGAGRNQSFNDRERIDKTVQFLRKYHPDVSIREELAKPFWKEPMFYSATSLLGFPYEKWSVKIGFALDIIFKLYNLSREAFLYSPSSDEYPDCQDWFLPEDKSSRFSEKLSKISLEAKDEETLLSNLAKPIDDAFDKFLTGEYKDTLKPQVPFAPSKDESIGIAIEKAIRFRKERNYGQFYDLLRDWEKYLKKLIFAELDWSEEKRQACFAKMKIFFYRPIKIAINEKKKEGSRAIDRHTAAEIILYFVQKSIQYPRDRRFGQIACILWLLIWISKETVNTSVSLHEVIFLSSQQINIENKSLLVNGEEIEISRGLMDMLSILLGKRTGKLNLRLFPDINRRNLKNAVEKASKELFSDRKTPITPESFCHFPHPFQYVSIPNSILGSFRNSDGWTGQLEEAKASILMEFHKKKSSSKPS